MIDLALLVVAVLLQDSSKEVAALKPTVREPLDSAPYETMLGKLGSRLAIDFKPQFARVAVSPMGRFYDKPLEMTLGIRYGGKTRVLPFTKQLDRFEAIEQHVTPTRVVYLCTSPKFPFGVRVTWIAPFCPRNEKLTTAPFLYLDVEIDNPSRMTYDAEVLVSLPIDGQDLVEPWDAFRGVSVQRSEAGRRTFLGLACDATGPVEVQRDGALLTIPIHVGPFATGARHLMLVGYVAEPVLHVRGAPFRFLYTRDFAGPDAVAAYARDERRTILERAALFDSTVLDTGITEPLKNLISFAFQSFAPNAWWGVGEDGSEWFSVWEGYCRYHSTLDVEYNDALFYLQYWPELLGMLLDEWAQFPRDGGFPSHDLGGGSDLDAGLVIAGQAYGHDMEVEESANFILLLDAYWRATADADRALRLLPFAASLARLLIDCDVDGDGFPDRGTGNTLDDACEAVQFGNGQTYLGVKTLAALASLEDLLGLAPDAALKRRLIGATLRLTRTLTEDAWLGDHYAICLDKERGRTRNPWNGRLLPPGELDGWDGFSIYASNGLLLPWRSGLDVPVDRRRLRSDLVAAFSRTLRAFGCAHSDGEENGWISQNLWRDMVAAHLGVNFEENAERYWSFELRRNRDASLADWGGFCDSPTNRWLSYYPRGVAAIGLIPALAGLEIDVPGRMLRYAPVRSDLSVPLTLFADWETGEMPWLRIRRAPGDARLVAISRRDRLSEFRVVDRSLDRDDGVAIDLKSGECRVAGHRTVDGVEPAEGSGYRVRLSSYAEGTFRLSLAPVAAERYVLHVNGARFNDFTRDDLKRGIVVPVSPGSSIPPGTLAAAEDLAARIQEVERQGEAIAPVGLDRVLAAIDALWAADRRDRPTVYEFLVPGVEPASRRGPPLDDPPARLERALVAALRLARELPAPVRAAVERALAPVDVRFDVAPMGASGRIGTRLRLRNDLMERATITARLAAVGGLISEGSPVASFSLARGERTEWSTGLVTSGIGSPLEVSVTSSVVIETDGGGPPVEIVETAPVGEGFVSTWLVCGPFPDPDRGGLDVAYGPEVDPRPAPDPQGPSAGRPPEWREFRATGGTLDFRAAIGAGGASIAYANAYLHCGESGTVRFSLGSDDGIKLFVDGREVHRKLVNRPATPDEDAIDVSLDAGWHRVLAKVENTEGEFGLYLRCRAAGGRGTGLRSCAIPPPELGEKGENR